MAKINQVTNLFVSLFPDDWMEGQVCCLCHYPLVSPHPDHHHPDHHLWSLSRPLSWPALGTWGHEVRGNQNKPLFTQSIPELLFSRLMVTPCEDTAVLLVWKDYNVSLLRGEGRGNTGGGGWWDLTTTKHQEMEIIWTKLMQEMTFNLPIQKQLSLLLRRSLACRDSYWPINC